MDDRFRAVMSSEREDWGTPAALVRAAARLLGCGGFDLDAAAGATNHKAARYWTKDDNGLIQPWHGRTWLNPPWSRKTKATIDPWMGKAVEETRAGRASLVAALVPARTDVAWWHTWVLPCASEVAMIRGRVPFDAPPGKVCEGNAAAFPSALVVYRHGVAGPPRFYSWRPILNDDDSAKGDEGVRFPVVELRQRLELTQARFAWLLVVDVATVSRWEAGREPTQAAAWMLDELRDAVTRHGWAQVSEWCHRARYTRGEAWGKMLAR